MNTLNILIRAFREGEELYNKMAAADTCSEFSADEIYCTSDAEEAINSIGNGDNLKYMDYLIKGKKLKGKFQLIYVDPPFYSDSRYQASIKLNSELLGNSELIRMGAYDDRWSMDLGEYIKMLTARFLMMRDLLSETGCLWVHLDWHAVHYVKIILDQIFGENNFINEIVWTYKSGGANKRSFAKKHDTLLFYSKTERYTFNPLTEKSYNRKLKPYRFKGVKEYQDDIGWYTIVNMKDVWNIDMVGRTSFERTGYATQKPEKLLERIVEACSSEGDLCADFFAGSGTFGAVCGKLKRNWVLCDCGDVAVADQICRLAGDKQSFIVERDSDSCKSGNIGDIDIEVDNGKIILKDHIMNVSDVDCSSSRTVEEYYKRDSLSLIKFWGIDTEFEGSVPKINKLYDSGIREIQIKNNSKGQSSVIVGYNVFGGRFTAEIGLK